MAEKKKAVIYARTSSRRQNYDSITNQIDKANEYAIAHDYDVVNIYEDVAFSGRTDRRPAFLQLISDCNTFEVVLVLRYDRWARNEDIAVRYEQMLNDNGAFLVSVTEDEKDKLERFRKAEESSLHKSEAVLDKMNDLADEHKHLGGPMLLGFSKDSLGGYQINNTEAVLVRDIFRRYADGETADEIVEDLNAHKIPAVGVKSWNRKTLQVMLQNEKYIGRYSWGAKSEDDAIPQIVSNEVFEQVQKKLLENAALGAHAKASGENEFLLSGKLRCGCCGKLMKGNTSNGISYYKCGNKNCRKTSLHKDELEDMVFDLSCEFLTEESNALIAKKYVEYRNSITPEKEVQRLTGEILRKKNLLNTLPAGSESRKLAAKEVENLEYALESEKRKAAILTENEVRYILHELYLGNIDAWYLRKFIMDTLVSKVSYDGELLTIDFNLTDRFMSFDSESQQQYQVIWHDPEDVLE